MKLLHIELTNRCFLECPACPRTEWHNILKKPVTKKDLDYTLLDKFLDCPGGKEIDKFLLCGDYGDCIYYPRLIEFLVHFRQTKKFTIATNGSRKSPEFWHTLASILTDHDEIVFGIDGLEEDNQLYRKNSHWPSIMEGLEIMSKSQVKVIWQTIVFKFNYNKLSQIKQFAESKGATYLQLKTHRYGDDNLIPDVSFVNVQNLYKKEYNSSNYLEIDPKCNKNDSIPTIGCDGIYYPCDWLRNPNTLYKSQLWKQKSRWLDALNIEKINYDDAKKVIDDWANYVHENSLSDGPVDALCKMKCRKELFDARL